ncbi:hypothetical protein [Streptomyces sp. NBC_01477]|uniref:hypothetical protein n=1 Tax=Streptomyces sp. NBC_01477 TaxID=2976015 RepID=UPI002E2FE9F6|nr:hypothetical protein [Streptomyces sp. NBC_01477]
MLTSQYAPECTPYGAAVSPPPPEPVADGDGLSGGALVGAAVGGAVLDGAAVGGVPAVGCGTEAPPAGCGWACPSGPPDLPGPGEPEAPGEAVPPGTAGDGDIPSFPPPDRSEPGTACPPPPRTATLAVAPAGPGAV